MSKHVLTEEQRNQKAEQKQRAQDEQYMQGRPTRLEVCNYVNALLEDKYTPAIQSMIAQTAQAAQVSIMVMQSILIQKGLTTGDELKELTNMFMKRYSEELKKAAQKEDDKADITVE